MGPDDPDAKNRQFTWTAVIQKLHHGCVRDVKVDLGAEKFSPDLAIRANLTIVPHEPKWFVDGRYAAGLLLYTHQPDRGVRRE